MHERERHKLILSAVQERPVATIGELVEMTATSEATIRRDISALHIQGRLRRVRGGAEALHPPQFVGIAGRPFKVSEAVNIEKKRAIAEAAVKLCADGDSIILNAGTTTFQMVHFLSTMRLQVMTNSFPIAEHLIKNSRNNVMVPGGLIYREQARDPLPFRGRRDAELFRAAHVHGRARRRPARRDGARPADGAGRAQADRAGGAARRARRLLEIRAALEPDRLQARAGATRSSPTTAWRTTSRR